MTEEPQHTEEHIESHHARRDIIIFIIGSVIVAFMLVLVSLSLYVSSGAAQLDLSRPGYKSVQDKVEPTGTFESFPASGAVDNNTIEQFLKLFKKQVKPVANTDAFNASALDEQALSIDAPTDDN